MGGMSPTLGISPATAAQVRPFGVLVVGARNVCRSPVAERLLRARLGGGLVVASVGTHAAPEDEVPEPMLEHLGSVGAAAEGHVTRELDDDLVREADVVLTATRQERAEVVRAVPSAVRRTFTLRELARVARALGPGALPDGDVAERMSALVEAAALQRAPTAPRTPADDDVVDPYGRDVATYARSFDQVLAAVEDIVATVRPEVVTDEPGAGRLERPVPAVHPGRSRLHTVALVVLASLALVLVAGTTGALVAVERLDSRIQRFPDPFASLPTRPPPVEPPPGAPAADPALTVLVLGSTDDLATEGEDGWAAAGESTDVVLLAHVAADRRSAQVVAMPPDLWVDVPGSGPGALRSSVGRGGPALAVQTVEQLTDVRVDHVALTDAATFARVTQSLGGVDLEVTDDVVVDGRVAVPAGQRRLTGELTLLWVQAADDEAGRAERQQAWLRAILDRLGDDDVRGSSGTWLDLLGVVSGSVAVDEGLDRGTLIGLLTGLRSIRPGDVDVVAAPTAPGTAPDGTAVVVPDAEPFAALMAALRTDTLHEEPAAGSG